MKFHMCTKWDEGKSWFRVACRMMAWVETKPSDTYPAKENNRKCNVCMYVLQEPCNVPYISYGGSDYIERLEAVIACFSFSSFFQTSYICRVIKKVYCQYNS